MTLIWKDGELLKKMLKFKAWDKDKKDEYY